MEPHIFWFAIASSHSSPTIPFFHLEKGQQPFPIISSSSLSPPKPRKNMNKIFKHSSHSLFFLILLLSQNFYQTLSDQLHFPAHQWQPRPPHSHSFLPLHLASSPTVITLLSHQKLLHSLPLRLLRSYRLGPAKA